VRNNHKWGYIDKSGNTVIDFQYDDAFGFVNGIALVEINGRMGAINRDGKIVVKPEYLSLGEFKGELAHVKIGVDEWGYVNRSGELVIKIRNR
jgi:hypothetical protein